MVVERPDPRKEPSGRADERVSVFLKDGGLSRPKTMRLSSTDDRIKRADDDDDDSDSDYTEVCSCHWCLFCADAF